LEPVTSAGGFSSSRLTPTDADPTDGRLWPTPDAGMRDGANTCGDVSRPTLVALSKMWPTPTTLDWKDGDGSADVPTNSLLGRAAPRWSATPSRPDPGTPTPGADGSVPVYLSPLFVEALMGLPAGWTDCGCSETAWCHSRPPRPLTNYSPATGFEGGETND
jgi:hypothetical protein